MKEAKHCATPAQDSLTSAKQKAPCIPQAPLACVLHCCAALFALLSPVLLIPQTPAVTPAIYSLCICIYVPNYFCLSALP